MSRMPAEYRFYMRVLREQRRAAREDQAAQAVIVGVQQTGNVLMSLMQALVNPAATIAAGAIGVAALNNRYHNWVGAQHRHHELMVQSFEKADRAWIERGNFNAPRPERPQDFSVWYARQPRPLLALDDLQAGLTGGAVGGVGILGVLKGMFGTQSTAVQYDIPDVEVRSPSQAAAVAGIQLPPVLPPFGAVPRGRGRPNGRGGGDLLPPAAMAPGAVAVVPGLEPSVPVVLSQREPSAIAVPIAQRARQPVVAVPPRNGNGRRVTQPLVVRPLELEEPEVLVPVVPVPGPARLPPPPQRIPTPRAGFFSRFALPFRGAPGHLGVPRVAGTVLLPISGSGISFGKQGQLPGGGTLARGFGLAPIGEAVSGAFTSASEFLGSLSPFRKRETARSQPAPAPAPSPPPTSAAPAPVQGAYAVQLEPTGTGTLEEL